MLIQNLKTKTTKKMNKEDMKTIVKGQKELKKLLNPKYRKIAIKELAKKLLETKTFSEMGSIIESMEILMDIDLVKEMIGSYEDIKKGRFTTVEEIKRKMENEKRKSNT